VLGGISYTGCPGIDVFPSEADAYRYVCAHSSNLEPKVQVFAHAILGLVVLGNKAYLLLATAVSATVRLPGGHVVYTVNKCEWQTIALKTPDTAPEAEQKNLESLMSFPVADQFFFCETYDITRRWPALSPVAKYDPEFCWNDSLCNQFQSAGLRLWAAVLVQGQAVSSTVPVPQIPQEGAAAGRVAILEPPSL